MATRARSPFAQEPEASTIDGPPASVDLDKSAEKSAPKPAKVVTNNADERLLFKGKGKDARAFVEANFPRPHIEPGRNYDDDEGPQSDVKLVLGSGSEVTFNGDKWSDDDSEDGE